MSLTIFSPAVNNPLASVSQVLHPLTSPEILYSIASASEIIFIKSTALISAMRVFTSAITASISSTQPPLATSSSNPE